MTWFAPGQQQMTKRTEDQAGRPGRNLKVKPGLNRFEWDLNYPGPFTVDDLVTMVMRNPASGPKAVPGSYKVRLSSGETVKTETFEVKTDPRWDTSDSDLRQTFELATRISAMITRFQTAIKNMRSIRGQITEISDLAARNGFSPEIKNSADEICGRLSEVEDALINNNIKSGQDSIGMERRLSNRMGRLYQIVRDHDAAPTGGMKERLDDLEKTYDRYMGQYNELLGKDLEQFNKLLKKEGVGHILVP